MRQVLPQREGSKVMDFSFSEEQERFRHSLRDFLESTLSPRVGEIDEKGELPRDVIQAMADFGLFGLTISEEYGGTGAGFTRAAIAAEEIARADLSMAAAVYFLVEAGWGFIFDKYANPGTKQEILPDVIRGKAFLGIASTEASGGSDIASLSTSMRREGENLVVNGSKAYISGVREAASYGGGFVTIVKTDPGCGHRGLSLCYLPVKGQTGVTTRTGRQMGREGISNGFLVIRNAEIPGRYLIGEWNRGFYYAMEGFNCARTLVSAACIGAAEKALEIGIGHLKRRRVFDTPLANFEGIQFQLAEDHVRLESARMLVYKAAWMLDGKYSGSGIAHGEINKAAAAAKLSAPSAAFDIIKDVMTWHGAYGYTREAGLERGLRGVTSYVVGAEGAQNIMKLIIGRELLGRESAL